MASLEFLRIPVPTEESMSRSTELDVLRRMWDERTELLADQAMLAAQARMTRHPDAEAIQARLDELEAQVTALARALDRLVRS